MRTVRIASLVEGDGEVAAVPTLLRRIIQAINPEIVPELPRGFRHPSGSIRRLGGLERAVNAVAELYSSHAVLVLIDSDDDCPSQWGPELSARAAKARPDLQIAVVLAHREFEAWFLAAAQSLAGVRGLDSGLIAPESPEAIRDAKKWLDRQLPAGRRYSPTQDQAALSAKFDLQLARQRSRSFRKLWKEVERLLNSAHAD